MVLFISADNIFLLFVVGIRRNGEEKEFTVVKDNTSMDARALFGAIVRDQSMRQ